MQNSRVKCQKSFEGIGISTVALNLPITVHQRSLNLDWLTTFIRVSLKRTTLLFYMSEGTTTAICKLKSFQLTQK